MDMGVFGSGIKGQIVVSSCAYDGCVRQGQANATHNVDFVEQKNVPSFVDNNIKFTLRIDASAQPVGTPSNRSTSNSYAKDALLAVDVVPQIVSKLESLADRRSPMRAALSHLSFSPETNFVAGKTGKLSFFLRSCADYLVFGAGLVVGIASLCTLYPLFRCAWAYHEVQRLERGIESLKLGLELKDLIRRQENITQQQAFDFVETFRAQACKPKLLSTEFTSRWGELVDRELRYVINERVPNFFCVSSAEDAKRNKIALFAKGATFATAVSIRAFPNSSEKDQAGMRRPFDDFMCLLINSI